MADDKLPGQKNETAAAISCSHRLNHHDTGNLTINMRNTGCENRPRMKHGQYPAAVDESSFSSFPLEIFGCAIT